MKLNDPFNRLASRHRAGYESMRETMRRGGIDTPQAAREVIRQSRKRVLKFIGVGMVLLPPVIWLLPKVMPVTIALALFLVVFAVNSALNGQRYIQRYIDEELK